MKHYLPIHNLERKNFKICYVYFRILKHNAEVRYAMNGNAEVIGVPNGIIPNNLCLGLRYLLLLIPLLTIYIIKIFDTGGGSVWVVE